MADKPDLDAAVVKRGETVIITTLSRSARGLTVRCKAHPNVELFMKGLSEPDTPPVEVGVADRYWLPPPGSKTPLLAYRLSQNLESPRGVSGAPLFVFDKLARPLIDQEGDEMPHRDQPVNLSYLRLVGISEGMGVTFDIRGIYDLTLLESMLEKIKHAQQQFYVQYIRPVNLSVIVSTHEVQL